MRASDRVALIGAPNSGKTTLYNWLTNSKYKTVNYPGATVEYAVGEAANYLKTEPFLVVDTPGTYSLFPKSEDEEVTLKVLTQDNDFGRITHIVLVVDATQLGRHLLIAQQLKELGVCFLMVLTMQDLALQAGLQVDLRFLSEQFGCKALFFDGLLGRGLFEIPKALDSLQRLGPFAAPEPWAQNVFQDKRVEVDQISRRATQGSKDSVYQMIRNRTEKMDRWLLHPLYGLVLFCFVMTCLFGSIYSLSTPFMDLIDAGFTWLADQTLARWPDSLIAEFLSQGVIVGFASVLVFVPQIFILFLGVGFLESTGYLARAATLIDRPFSKLGLSGRSFVPLLSGFACAVPALMATRNLSSSRDRFITRMIIPLMTCSARVPVYALLLGFVFYRESALKAGAAMAGLYMGSVAIGVIGAHLLNRVLPASASSHLMMELPLYRRPRLGNLFHQSISKTINYITKAGPLIFVLSLVLWVGTRFPEGKTQTPGVKTAIEDSYLGQVGKLMEPLVEPMGIDWRVGIGILSSFAAREVFVSTLAVVFKIDGDEESLNQRLLQTMATAKNRNGDKILTTGSVLALLIFFMIALQCMATVGVQIRESGSYKIAIVQLVALNIVAYILAVAVFQVFRLIA